MHTHIGRYHSLQGVDFDARRGMTTLLLAATPLQKPARERRRASWRR
jgi:hypothetical protein